MSRAFSIRVVFAVSIATAISFVGFQKACSVAETNNRAWINEQVDAYKDKQNIKYVKLNDPEYKAILEKGGDLLFEELKRTFSWAIAFSLSCVLVLIAYIARIRALENANKT